MSDQRDFVFYVIEIHDRPDHERIVCVPNIWIRLRETKDGIVMVKFPDEELSDVKKLAMNREFSEKWPVVLADIKCGTNSYKDGNDFSENLNKRFVQEQNSTKVVKNVISKTVHKSILNTKAADTTFTVGNNNEAVPNKAIPMTKETAKCIDLTNTKFKTCHGKSTFNSVNSSSTARKYSTRQAVKRSLSINNTVSLPPQSERYYSSDTSNYGEICKTNHNQKNKPAVKNSPELPKDWLAIVVLRSVLGDNYREVLKQLHDECARNGLMLQKMYLEFMNNCKTFKQLIELIDNINVIPESSNLGDIIKELEKQMNVATINKKELYKEVGPGGPNEIKIATINEKNFNKEAGSTVQNQIQVANINEKNLNEEAGSEVQHNCHPEKDERHNSNSSKVENNNPFHKIHGKPCQFTLPAEYDAKDSKWTLKHREKKQGLVELLSMSGVFVDENQLKYCIQTSKDSNTFARKLLCEIFSESALSICSLTGKKSNKLDVERTCVRPGLDEDARLVLLCYVQKVARAKNWDEVNCKEIKRCIRCKLQEIRRKNK